jgi:hypothetical protein
VPQLLKPIVFGDSLKCNFASIIRGLFAVA